MNRDKKRGRGNGGEGGQWEGGDYSEHALHWAQGQDQVVGQEARSAGQGQGGQGGDSWVWPPAVTLAQYVLRALASG